MRSLLYLWQLVGHLVRAIHFASHNSTSPVASRPSLICRGWNRLSCNYPGACCQSEACALVGKKPEPEYIVGVDRYLPEIEECTCSASKFPFCTEWMPLLRGEFLAGIKFRKAIVLIQEALVSIKEDVGGLESFSCWTPCTLSDLRNHADLVTFSDFLLELIGSARAGNW